MENIQYFLFPRNIKAKMFEPRLVCAFMFLICHSVLASPETNWFFKSLENYSFEKCSTQDRQKAIEEFRGCVTAPLKAKRSINWSQGGWMNNLDEWSRNRYDQREDHHYNNRDGNRRRDEDHDNRGDHNRNDNSRRNEDHNRGNDHYDHRDDSHRRDEDRNNRGDHHDNRNDNRRWDGEHNSRDHGNNNNNGHNSHGHDGTPNSETKWPTELCSNDLGTCFSKLLGLRCLMDHERGFLTTTKFLLDAQRRYACYNGSNITEILAKSDCVHEDHTHIQSECHSRVDRKFKWFSWAINYADNQMCSYFDELRSCELDAYKNCPKQVSSFISEFWERGMTRVKCSTSSPVEPFDEKELPNDDPSSSTDSIDTSGHKDNKDKDSGNEYCSHENIAKCFEKFHEFRLTKEINSVEEFVNAACGTVNSVHQCFNERIGKCKPSASESWKNWEYYGWLESVRGVQERVCNNHNDQINQLSGSKLELGNCVNIKDILNCMVSNKNNRDTLQTMIIQKENEC